jgi:hypothetical protein
MVFTFLRARRRRSAVMLSYECVCMCVCVCVCVCVCLQTASYGEFGKYSRSLWGTTACGESLVGNRLIFEFFQNFSTFCAISKTTCGESLVGTRLIFEFCQHFWTFCALSKTFDFSPQGEFFGRKMSLFCPNCPPHKEHEVCIIFLCICACERPANSAIWRTHLKHFIHTSP